MREITVTAANERERLDKYLRHLLPQASGGFLYKMLRKKNITLNSKKAAGSELLRSGDVIRIYFSDETYERFSCKGQAPEDPQDRDPIPKKESLPLLYEDDDILAVHKPAGLLSQSDKRGGDCVNARVLSYLRSEGKLPTDHTPSIVNRLDRNTSGIVLAGKTYRGSRLLSDLIQDRQAKKTYYCIVSGHFTYEGIYRIYHFLSPEGRVLVSEEEQAGSREAVSEFFPEEQTRDHTLVKVLLHTGRKHQIRVSLSHLGFPIAGDVRYGGERADHLYLHAYSVELPGVGRIVDEVPDYFRRYLDADL